jgi:hypothetical protein
MILDTLTHSMRMSTVVGRIPAGFASDRLEWAIRRLAQQPAMRRRRPEAWGFNGGG